VLTLTTTRERVEQMLAGLHAITGSRGSNMFLFTDQMPLAASNPVDLEWLSGKREVVRLTD
jgi:hypothetical protein